MTQRRSEFATTTTVAASVYLLVLAGAGVCSAQSPNPWTSISPPPPAAATAPPAKIHDVAQTPVSIDVQDADVMKIVNAVGVAIGRPLNVQARFARLYSVSLKVSNMPVEDVLRAAAAFGHCELYILPDRFLITTSDMLSPDERKQLKNASAPPMAPRAGKSQPKAAAGGTHQPR